MIEGFVKGSLDRFVSNTGLQVWFMKNTEKAADFWIAVAGMIISIVLYKNASAMPKAARGIGPGDYPKIICTVLIVLCAVQIIRILAECRGFPLIDFQSINGKYILRAFLMILLSWVYYSLLKKVGFLILTPIYLYASFILFGYRKWIRGIFYSVAFSATVYFLFVKVFLVLLPKGILG